MINDRCAIPNSVDVVSVYSLTRRVARSQGIRIIEFSDQFHFYVQSNASTHVGGPHLPNLVCVFHRILKFGILEMPRRISLGLLFQIFPKSRFEIHAGLIGQANQDKKYIGQFVSNRLRFLTLFEALFPVNTGNQSGDFTNFFDQLGQIGEFRKVPNS